MDDRSNVLLGADTPQTPRRANRAAAVSFAAAAVSLTGLVLGRWVPGATYMFLAFIPAIISGHIARRGFAQCRGSTRDEGMATFGLAIGYFGLFLSILVISAMYFGLITFAPAP